MRLRLIYKRSTATPIHIVVTTDATATMGDVARELLSSDPSPTERVRFGNSVSLSVSPPGGGPPVIVPHGRAIGETAIASGCEITVVEVDPSREASPSANLAAAVLRVVAGPDAGKEFYLPQGSSLIGRDPTCAVSLDDDFVSKKHARIDVGPTIELVDLNSANGIMLDGNLVSRVVVLPGQEVGLGDNRLTATALSTAAPAPQTGGHGGSIPFNRSPRVEPRYPEREHPRPVVPTAVDNPAFPWLLMLVPVVLGLGLFALTRNPMSLMFVALAPLMMVGNFVTQRGRNKRQLQADIARFEEQLQVLERTLQSEIPRERETRQADAPPVVDVYQAALDRSQVLWTRRPEHWSFLHLRLGLGTLPSRNAIAAAADADNGLPEYTRRLNEMEVRYRLISDVPVVEDLLLAGALGVVGTKAMAADIARGFILQLAGLHSPAELVITALASPTEAKDYDWLAWLPHTSSPQSPITGTHLADSSATTSGLVSQLEELVDQRLGSAVGVAPLRGPLGSDLLATLRGGNVGQNQAEGASTPLPVIAILVTEHAPVDRARIVQLSERAATAGILPIWLASTPSDLPAICRTFVQVSSGSEEAQVHFIRHGEVVSPVAVERVTAEHAARFAHALAPLSDSGALVEDASDLPRQVTMLTLLGEELAASAVAVVDRWRQNDSIHQRGQAPTPRRRPGTLRAIVGQSGIDAMHLDLRTQGPHALVGGTTGSGKSEFLQAWVLGMAAEYSPDRVTFLFVDYKGGAAFADCVALPHCVGLVTDLDPHLVRRALDSLRAELQYREHLITRTKKAKDLLELEKRGDPEVPPALVLVIDEFAALKGEVPEFVEGVVDIAQRGRSLGIHLIMATQRPAGIIQDNLRANTNLRIALRMADESDSTDVLGTSEAATLDPAIPGRGVAKTGPGRLMPFQSGYAGGHTESGPPRASIVIHPLGFGADQPWEKPEEDAASLVESGDPTDQERLVASLKKAAALADIPMPRRPWLDELGKAYDLMLLQNRTDEALILGVKDLPKQQRQEIVTFNPDDDGNLAIYGTGGSGKTVALRTLACAAAVTPRGGPINVYCLDFAAGGLKMLELLPHVGAVISGDDSERVVRLLRMLRDLADRRTREFPANVGSITEYRALADRPDEPRVLLLLDGFGAFRDQWESGAGRAQWYGVFQQLLSEGRRLGIHVVFTADRPASVPGAVASSVPRRVVLRLAEDTMYTSLDVKSDVLGPHSPPGRTLVDGEETQIAIYGGSGNVADQFQAIRKHAQSIERHGRIPAPGVGALPTVVSLDTLPRQVEGQPVLGISDENLEPIGFAPSGTFLVGGGPLSGRSNALAVLALSLRHFDPDTYLVFLGNHHSRLPGLLDWDDLATAPEQVTELARKVTARMESSTRDKCVVVVESLSDFTSAPTDTALIDLVKAAKRSDHLVIAEAETSAWQASYSLFGQIKSGRHGILLQPDTNDGDIILKTPFPRVSRSEFPPGRGLLVERGKVVRVQLPLV